MSKNLTLINKEVCFLQKEVYLLTSKKYKAFQIQGGIKMAIVNSFSFPAIRGIQASKEYFTVMCPLRLVPKIFTFTDEELRPELRAQRILNKARIPEMADYLLNNPKNYVFSSITASIDSDYDFKSIDKDRPQIGMLSISMDCKFVINDGQHRRAAIEEALRAMPDLAGESISVVFFIDEGLKRSQQLFADLNRHAVRPNQSIGILYDHRSPLSQLTRDLIEENPIFNGLTEKEKSSISNRSIKLFTISAIHNATKALLDKTKKNNQVTKSDQQKAMSFWKHITSHFPHWKSAQSRQIPSAMLREEYIHAHGVVLQALGLIGQDILKRYPTRWHKYLKNLAKINWARSNTKLWEGNALINGRVSKSADSIKRTAIVIKKQLKIPLTSEDRAYLKQ